MPRALPPAGLILALILVSASVALADPPAPAATPGGPPERPRLFISPSGEPFRGRGGREAWFDQADADHDGAITLAEFKADAMAFFKRLDANGDGVIDSYENQTYESKIAPEITSLAVDEPGGAGGGGFGGGGSGGHHGHRGGGGGGGGGGGFGGGSGGGQKSSVPLEGAARFSMLNEPQPVRGADVNLDYKVTADEWAKTAAKRFALLDTDHDGKLTLLTLPKPPSAGRRHRHGDEAAANPDLGPQLKTR